MKTYLVGGAVRDQLLGLPVRERDFVVVGATIEDMIAKGFKPVGKAFPVFLHPVTFEEYALARTEKKVGKGYKGFTFYTSPDITLEEDLKRRDLTINAMAQDEEGKIIDPFGGQDDLNNKQLRHVSDAFAEDPVRALRVARFASRFCEFTVAAETNQLMRQLVLSGEVDALVPERVFQELNGALKQDCPWRFFEVLRACDALAAIFPEIDILYSIPNPPEHHPEVDTGTHTLLALKRVVGLTSDPAIRFAVIAHDLGKALTPETQWPRHIGHEKESVVIVKAFCKRLHVPSDYQSLALIVAEHHGHCHKALKLNAGTLVKLMKALDPYRRPERFEKFLIACQADAQGRLGRQNEPYPQADFLRRVYQVCAEVKIEDEWKTLDSKYIEQQIHQRRVAAVKKLMKDLG